MQGFVASFSGKAQRFLVSPTRLKVLSGFGGPIRPDGKTGQGMGASIRLSFRGRRRRSLEGPKPRSRVSGRAPQNMTKGMKTGS